MMPHRPPLLASLALLIAAAVSSAGAGPPGPAGSRTGSRMVVDAVPDSGQFLPDTALLGSVNGKPLRVRDFVESYFNAYAPDRPTTDSAGRVEWLNSMVNKEIMASVARRVNYQPDFAERATLRGYEQRVLSNTLYQRRVADSIRVSDAQVDSLLGPMRSEYHLQHILTPSRGSADSAWQAVTSRALSWHDAVKRFSVAANDSGPDGEIGWVNLLPASPDMTFELARLATGAISRPVADRDGWHVLKLIATRPGPEFDESILRRAAADKCRARREALQVEALTAQMRVASGIVYEEANIRWACGYFPAPRSVQNENGVMTMHFSTQLPVFSPVDTGRVLARSAEGQLTLSRFVSELGQISPMRRPAVNTPEEFKAQIDRVVFEPYRAKLARELGLDRDPLSVGLMAKRVEQMQVEHLYQDSIEARVRTTPAEARRYYDSHPADFMTYPKARYAMFVFPTRAQADSMVAVLKGATDVEQLVERAPRVDGHKTATIREEKDQDHGDYHTLLFSEIKPGQSYVDGPDKSGQYAVIHSLEFDPGHLLPFTEARGYADEQVRARSSEALLNAFLKRHRRGMRITLHPELVTRVRLLDPAAQSD